jgi:phage/plasmid-like protein (TIGR03299 family)
MDYFTEGFCVRKPSWHKKETLLDDYPGRDEAIVYAGHNFEVVPRRIAIETPVLVPAGNLTDDLYGALPTVIEEPETQWNDLNGWKALVRSDNGHVLHVATDSYEIIQNEVGWDLIDNLVGEGARYETGLTLHDGAVCIVTAWLDEPVKILGDDSPTLPYAVVRWAHDGSAALTCRSTSVRVVCANTDGFSSQQAKKLGTEFTFRHTKNVQSRIEDAKLAIRGMRVHHEEFVELANELAKTPITKEQRDLFISQFIPTPPEALISDRVKNNIDKERAKVRRLFDPSNASIPEAHKLTAYGLRLAGVEYLDHLRGFRNDNTYVGRQLLRQEPAKAKLGRLIEEVVHA